jgi:hypothetical protein
MLLKAGADIKALGKYMPPPFIVTLTPQDLRFQWLGNALLVET